jgi:tetratricopeptide (TPR) repeat protein
MTTPTRSNVTLTIKQAAALAAQYYEKGDRETARTLCRQILQLSGDDSRALNILALLARDDGRYDQALSLLERSFKIDKNWDQTHVINGAVLNKMGRLNLAAESYNRALAINPDNFDAHNNLTSILQDLDCPEEATSHGRKAVALAPGSPIGFFNLGNCLFKQDKFEDAIFFFQKALALNPDFPMALQQLATACLQNGDFTAARQNLEKLLVLNPGDIGAHFSLSALKKYTASDRAFNDLETALKTVDLPQDDRINARFCLGKMYEDIADYDTAFHHFNEGNILRTRKSGTFDPEKFTKVVSLLMETCTKDFFARYKGMGDSRHRPIFIIGMPRSGTTLVEQILSCHSRVHGAGELDFLAECLETLLSSSPSRDTKTTICSLTAPQVQDLARNYLEKLPMVPDSVQRMTDKMPGNFIHLWLAALMFPNATIIHCKRHPLDTCLSCFTKNFQNSHEYANDLTWLENYYRNYQQLMQHWKKVLPLSILDVTYETVVTDLENESRRILSHCNLAWEDTCLEFHRYHRRIQTASQVQVRQPVYTKSIGRWKHYARHLEALTPLL